MKKKIIERLFAENFPRCYEKNMIHGTSDAWLTKSLSHQPSEPAYSELTDFRCKYIFLHVYILQRTLEYTISTCVVLFK